MTRPPSARPTEPGAASDWVFDALGTQWAITVPEPLPASAVEAVEAELDRIDVTWSRFRDDSLVAHASREAGTYPLAASDQPLIDWYRRLYDATGGAFSPFVGQTLADAGYGPGYSLNPAESVTPVPAWDDVLTGYRGALEVVAPTMIDVGAAGKGFAVDRVARIVAEYTDTFIVDGSGDMVVSERTTPVRIALEHPADPMQAIGVVELATGAICASAVTRRSWADWHHVVDPRTSRPTVDVVATWVVAASTMIADGLATALFFTPADELHDRLGIDFRFVTIFADGTADYSPWPGLELFS
ncbi:hypothetical protein GOARA_011_00030 [Gordonia araii NBRC 100433]|uniref:FAD:protein FMN transferase n=1 Tax=Gordonia araii NBRC 100433 TaxID=1073574 RepID=G7GXR2_9ACTN|nr:FAD:protein FMN transferase [Gordonia araii]NNG98418.1 FAD:protein FMN transferase [Gordonia araii NBRC 100433]GAB08387.1 hypothetical protein GOARA_011_00030 [Gordonia araii NBRC 100433]